MANRNHFGSGCEAFAKIEYKTFFEIYLLKIQYSNALLKKNAGISYPHINHLVV